MWAQGWTIALVVGAAITSQAPVRERVVDHSWRQMVSCSRGFCWHDFSCGAAVDRGEPRQHDQVCMSGI